MTMSALFRSCLLLPAIGTDRSKRGDDGLPTPDLIAAVAGIVAIAADKARVAGDLDALRHAIEAALGPAKDGRDPRAEKPHDLPRIADADPPLEPTRLAALAEGQVGQD